jgi:hypothetical protein
MNDELIKMMIAIMRAFYDTDSISKYQASISSAMNAQLSEISKSNLKARLMIHAIASSQKELYLDAVKAGTSEINSFSLPTSLLSEVSGFIDEIISGLKVAQYDIESNLELPFGTLDLFASNDEEKSMVLAGKENTDPLYLNFFTLRRLAVNNSNILKQFTDCKASIETSTESLKQSTVIRDDMIMNLIASGLKSMGEYYNILTMLWTGCLYALQAYTTYTLSSRNAVETFLNRPYAQIRDDIEIMIA